MVLRILFAVLVVTAASSCGGYSIFGDDQLSSKHRQLAAEMKGTIKTYLEQHISETGFGGKPFCEYDVLGIEQNGEQFHTYIYAICQEYYLKGQDLTKGTGLALPIALLMQKDGTQYRVLSHESTRDGAEFSVDVERIFPRNLHKRIFAEPQNNRAILDEIETEAKQYFQK
jgi:hypothetical protein